MDAIYPVTALQKQQGEVKKAAQAGIVRITENGKGAYVFCSEEVFERMMQQVAEDAYRSPLGRPRQSRDTPTSPQDACSAARKQPWTRSKRECTAMPELMYTEGFIEDIVQVELESKRKEIFGITDLLSDFPKLGSIFSPASIFDCYGGSVRSSP